MIIEINDEYRISSDSMNWITQKKFILKDKIVWRNLGYYLGFGAAVTALSEYRIRKIEGDIPSEILSAIESIKADAARVAMEFTQTTT